MYSSKNVSSIKSSDHYTNFIENRSLIRCTSQSHFGEKKVYEKQIHTQPMYGKYSIIYIKWFCGLILPLLLKNFCTISAIFLFISLNINVSVLWEFQKWHSMLGLSFLMRVFGRKSYRIFFLSCCWYMYDLEKIARLRGGG